MTLLNEELNDLVNELREIEARISELTGDTVDTVIDQHGMPFMLSQAQHELRERAEIHRQYAEQQADILNTIPANITLLDGEGNLITVNDAWREFAKANDNTDVVFGIGKNYLKMCEATSGDDAQGALIVAAGIRSVLLGQKSSFTMEYPCHSPSKQRWFRLMVSPLKAGAHSGAVVMHLDITDRKLADNEMQRALSVFKSSSDGILITDANLMVLDSNPAYSVISGYEKADVVGQKIKFINFELQSEGLEEITKQSLNKKGFWRGEVRNRRKSGEVYIENLSISLVYDDQLQLLNYIAIFSDITKSKTHEAELDHVANHDPLTGLPNRRLLTDRLQQAMLKAKRDNDLLALCYIDLDDFKPINDKLGHTIGDRVLIEVSNRLISALRESDTVSRIGGDEFILLLPNLNLEAELHELLHRLMAKLDETVFINEFKVQVSASIGVVLFPDDDVDGDTLLRHADQAMYIAKESGRNQYHIYDSKLAKQIENRISFVDEIKNSLLAKDFVLFYQPKVNLVDGTIIGFEALVRWQHPVSGLLSPATFLPAIIGTDIETVFGEYVMRCAIEQLNDWQTQGHRLQVSVNVSANELRQANLIDVIMRQLQRFPALGAEQLEIEVLETAAIEDMAQVISSLNRCRAAGIQVSLDDFGTGYSSLTIFRQLPVDIIKIDQSFV
ncbi:MAG TPA: diguanylate cyclase, partial [Methylotenera sp.]|nr:diguanylate cyclase [Methylotenera sp.]